METKTRISKVPLKALVLTYKFLLKCHRKLELKIRLTEASIQALKSSQPQKEVGDYEKSY